MRVACVLIPDLPIQLLLAEQPELSGKPVVVGGLAFEIKPVSYASPEAIAYGVRLGMSIREAQALCPEAICVAPDEERYQQTFEKVADLLEDFSPLVEVDEIGRAYIDITGVQMERQLAHEVISLISGDIGLSARIGIASGKFFSMVAAATSRPESVTIVPVGEEESFIRPFSIDFISSPDEVKERLRFLGIKFIGQLREFPKEALVSQFGADGIRLYQLSHGIDPTPLVPRKKTQVVSASCELEPATDTWSGIEMVCRTTLEKLLVEVRRQGKVCCEALVKLRSDSGPDVERRLPLKEGSRSANDILARIRSSLEDSALPGPVIGIELSLHLANETGRGLHLWQKQRQPLNKLASELKRRFGYQPLKKITEIDPDTIVPERRFGLSDISD
jgi:DNA polymerase-4